MNDIIKKYEKNEEETDEEETDDEISGDEGDKWNEEFIAIIAKYIVGHYDDICYTSRNKEEIKKFLQRKFDEML